MFKKNNIFYYDNVSNDCDKLIENVMLDKIIPKQVYKDNFINLYEIRSKQVYKDNFIDSKNKRHEMITILILGLMCPILLPIVLFLF
jgi:hypothetical protein